jgi:hypothetical protein
LVLFGPNVDGNKDKFAVAVVKLAVPLEEFDNNVELVLFIGNDIVGLFDAPCNFICDVPIELGKLFPRIEFPTCVEDPV